MTDTSLRLSIAPSARSGPTVRRHDADTSANFRDSAQGALPQ